MIDQRFARTRIARFSSRPAPGRRQLANELADEVTAIVDAAVREELSAVANELNALGHALGEEKAPPPEIAFVDGPADGPWKLHLHHDSTVFVSIEDSDD